MSARMPAKFVLTAKVAMMLTLSIESDSGNGCASGGKEGEA